METTSKIAELGLISMLHDMNNPLTSIRLSMELLESGTVEVREIYYNIIKKNVAQIEDTIREIYTSFVDNGITLNLSVDEPFLQL